MNDADAIKILKEFMSSDWDSAKCKEADQALTYLLSRFEELSKVPEELPEKLSEFIFKWNRDSEWDRLTEGVIKEIAHAILLKYRLIKK